MIVRITNKCSMMCRHCFNDSNPSGKHMTWETFVDVKKFLKNINPTTLIISGGEPFDHPNAIEWIQQVRKYAAIVGVTSNGLFLYDQEKKRQVIELVESQGIYIQITNDPDFYPKRVPIIKHKLFTYEHKVNNIVPAGRAIVNYNTFVKQNPKCFNFRSITKNTKDFLQTVNVTENTKEYCTPLIDVDGNIRICEINTGYIVGHVTSTNEDITSKILNMKCNRCGLFNNVSSEVREMIGE